MKIRCLVVDDEPLARRVLEKYFENLPGFELAGSCQDALEAMAFLREDPNIEVLLLDINMPKVSGISMVKAIPHPPLVIFTTAYPEYAVEGFELEAIDYLLKPFTFERFLKALNKAAQRIQAPRSESPSTFMLLKADKKLYKINHADILYLEALGDYVKVFTSQQMLLTKDRLLRLFEELPAAQFMQVHRSFVVALSAIQYIEGNQIKLKTATLPIGASYREELMERLKK